MNVDTLRKAFEVVDPSFTSATRSQDWKAPINAWGAEDAFERWCAHIGVTMDDVIASVPFMTATEAKVTRWEADGVRMIRIEADGYRKGPAGDH